VELDSQIVSCSEVSFPGFHQKISEKSSLKRNKKFVSEWTDDIFVAEDKNGKVVGVVFGFPGRCEVVAKTYCVRFLVVSEKRRREGIATEMMEFLKRHVSRKGFKFVSLTVNQSNVEAKNFYEKNEFLVEGLNMVRKL
jgi:ribosomal protein S18 acetylase RimI-like enzyme